MLRRLNTAAPNKTWLLSSTASLLIVPAVPFLALPAFALLALAAGQIAVYSLLMALPIALSVGTFGGLIDGILFRLLLRGAGGRKRMWFILGTNLLVTLVAVGALVALMLAHPPQVIAMVGGWRDQAIALVEGF
jgi:hypothetical protein